MTKGRKIRWAILALAAAALLLPAGRIATQLGYGQGMPPVQSQPGDRTPIPCPADAIVIVLFGQSLSANSGIPLHPATDRATYNFHDGRCYALRDPMLGATGRRGSIGPPLAAMTRAKLGRPVVLIAGGVGGSSITQWTPADSALTRPLLDRLASAARIGLAPAAYIWMQGEADAGVHMSSRRYAGELRKLHRRFPPAPWIITSNSICANRPIRSRTLDRAREDFAATTRDIHLGVDVDSLGPAFRQGDRCHLNEAGQQRVARMLADALAAVIGRPQTGSGRL